MKLSKTEKEIIAYLKMNPSATIEDISKDLFYSRTSVTRFLKTLKDKKAIERIGTTTSGYYIVKE